MLAFTSKCWTGKLLNKFCPLGSPNKPLLIVAKEIIIGPLDLFLKSIKLVWMFFCKYLRVNFAVRTSLLILGIN